MRVQADMNVQDCPNCDVIFAITEQMEGRRRTDGKNFYCPNGHPMGFGNSAVKRLEKKLGVVRAEVSRTAEALLEEKTHHASTRAALAKAKKPKGKM